MIVDPYLRRSGNSFFFEYYLSGNTLFYVRNLGFPCLVDPQDSQQYNFFLFRTLIFETGLDRSQFTFCAPTPESNPLDLRTLPFEWIVFLFKLKIHGPKSTLISLSFTFRDFDSLTFIIC